MLAGIGIVLLIWPARVTWPQVTDKTGELPASRWQGNNSPVRTRQQVQGTGVWPWIMVVLGGSTHHYQKLARAKNHKRQKKRDEGARRRQKYRTYHSQYAGQPKQLHPSTFAKGTSGSQSSPETALPPAEQPRSDGKAGHRANEEAPEQSQGAGTAKRLDPEPHGRGSPGHCKPVGSHPTLTPNQERQYAVQQPWYAGGPNIGNHRQAHMDAGAPVNAPEHLYWERQRQNYCWVHSLNMLLGRPTLIPERVTQHLRDEVNDPTCIGRGALIGSTQTGGPLSSIAINRYLYRYAVPLVYVVPVRLPSDNGGTTVQCKGLTRPEILERLPAGLPASHSRIPSPNGRPRTP